MDGAEEEITAVLTNLQKIDEQKREARRTESIRCWKAWAAFLRPKSKGRNSNNPKGAITAILWMSSGECASDGSPGLIHFGE